MNKDGFRRKFDSKFFDETAALRFFKVATEDLPTHVMKGPSFYEMMYENKKGVEEIQGKTRKEQQTEGKNKNKEEQEEEEEEEQEQEEASQEKIDNLKYLLDSGEFDGNWGESQDLYNLTYPGNW